MLLMQKYEMYTIIQKTQQKHLFFKPFSEELHAATVCTLSILRLELR
jgi:hypothetical protein